MSPTNKLAAWRAKALAWYRRITRCRSETRAEYEARREAEREREHKREVKRTIVCVRPNWFALENAIGDDVTEEKKRPSRAKFDRPEPEHDDWTLDNAQRDEMIKKLRTRSVRKLYTEDLEDCACRICSGRCRCEWLHTVLVHLESPTKRITNPDRKNPVSKEDLDGRLERAINTAQRELYKLKTPVIFVSNNFLQENEENDASENT